MYLNSRIQSLRDWKEVHPVNVNKDVNLSKQPAIKQQEKEKKQKWGRLFRNISLNINAWFYNEFENFFSTIQPEYISAGVVSEPVDVQGITIPLVLLNIKDRLKELLQAKVIKLNPEPVLIKNRAMAGISEVGHINVPPEHNVMEPAKKMAANVFYFFEINIYKILKLIKIKALSDEFIKVKRLTVKAGTYIQYVSERFQDLIYEMMEKLVGKDTLQENREFRIDIL